jgi:hypothetical protein
MYPSLTARFDQKSTIKCATCGILSCMPELNAFDFADLYAKFHQPITSLDCGIKCAPYNQHGVPFCCDTRHAIPSAYRQEWEYLNEQTDLWHLWQSHQKKENDRLQAKTPASQVLVECMGYLHCQRQFRTLTCRSFPFFPYITKHGDFIGLSYYWEYEDRCWVISHLDQVSIMYLNEFICAYEMLFQAYQGEKETFRYHSSVMRRVFSRRKRSIPLLHRNGGAYKITPANGRMRKISPSSFQKYGPYQVAARLIFRDEFENGGNQPEGNINPASNLGKLR